MSSEAPNHKHGDAYSALPSGLLSCLLGARVRVHVSPDPPSSSSSFSSSSSSAAPYAAAEGELAAVSPRGDISLRGARLLASWPVEDGAAAAAAAAPSTLPSPLPSHSPSPSAPPSAAGAAAVLQLRAGAVRLVELLALPGAAGPAADAPLDAHVARHMRALDAAAAAAAALPGARRFGRVARAPAALGPALGVASVRPAR